MSELDPSLQIPPELLESYKKSITEKILNLERLYESLTHNFEKETLTELRREVHKIAGSAESYGYPRVSLLCKEFEIYILPSLDNLPQKSEVKEQLVHYKNYIFQIKESF